MNARWLLGGCLLFAVAPVFAQRVELDATFAPRIESEAQTLEGTAFVGTPAGQLFAVGHFNYVNGTAIGGSGVVRLLADGSRDPSFAADIGSGRAVFSVVPLPDGKVAAVTGPAYGVSYPNDGTGEPIRVVRLLADGRIDPAFAAVTFDRTLVKLARQPDGALIAWGEFTTVNGQPRNSLARILTDGTVDPAFATSWANPALSVESLVVDSDGRTVLSGVSYGSDGPATYYFVRLTSTGALDAAFAPAEGRTFRLLAATPDGEVLAGNGDLTKFKADGTRDPAFTPAISNLDNISRVIVLEDGRIAIELGARPTTDALAVNVVYLLRSDGSLERDFRDLPGAERTQHLAAALSDGCVAIVQGALTMVPGVFMEWSYWEVPGMADPKLCVVDLAAGSLTTLPTTLALRSQGNVSRLALDAGGGVRAEGYFTHIDDQPRAGSARFFADGTLDPAFTPEAVVPVFHLPDGRLIGRQTTLGAADAHGVHHRETQLVRLLADGTLDPTFNPPADLDLLSANWLAATADGRVLVAVFTPDSTREENLKLVWLADDGHVDATLPTVFGEFTLGYVVAVDLAQVILPGAGVGNAVQSAVVLPDGRLLVASAARKVNGGEHPFLVRLNADGSVDETYQPDFAALPTNVSSAQPLSDGRALVFGYNVGPYVSTVFRLNPDGSRDVSFDPQSPVGRGQLLADGSWFYNGRRYLADGTLDLNFHPTFDQAPSGAVLDGAGHLWVGGDFTSVNGQPHAGLVRFNLIETPGFTVMPESRTIVAGRSVTLQAALGTSTPATYQWTLNGADLAGATAATLTLTSLTAAQAGDYRLVATTGGVTYTSEAATLTVAPNTTRIVNFSARSWVSPGGAPQIGGFVLRDAAAHPVLLRAIGSGLAYYGVPYSSTLRDPVLRLHDGMTQIGENADGALATRITDLAARLGAFPEPETIMPVFRNTHDAALAPLLSAGTYSAQTFASAGGLDAGAGISLFEFYDAADPANSAPVANVSLRGFAGAEDKVLVAGFVVAGNGPVTLLIRGAGPALASFGVAGALGDPQVTLYRGSTVLAQNDHWSASADASAIATAAQTVGAFSFPDGSDDAALLVTLEPGVYTVQGSGVAGATGEMMVELYVVP
ncbi:hypothetical protein K0B96_16855 [Horticoccus luteus]|uniref:Ig-like domain-containing protein n=1 Tax=Horticoccus luteus TaxID=2862869 RepID=A0A8F9TVV5_9BACT|nr:hypothetical protein [Horticoccus luteus]QYM78951.1 hypothetical protein K0B96_16855 [Horticoccus luteus]